MIQKIYRVNTGLGNGYAQALFDGRTVAWKLLLPAEDSALCDDYAFSNGEIFCKRRPSTEREGFIRARVAELEPRLRKDILNGNVDILY